MESCSIEEYVGQGIIWFIRDGKRDIFWTNNGVLGVGPLLNFSTSVKEEQDREVTVSSFASNFGKWD